MKTAQITYYGEGPLNLQIRRFKSGKSVKTRLDDILPDERRRYADRFLVIGLDGAIINIGSMVPTEVAKLVIGVNPRVYKVPGFDVCIPPGYALDDSGAEPKVVEASVMAAKQTATAVADRPTNAPNLTLLKESDELPGGVTVDSVEIDEDTGEAKISVTPPVPAEEVDVTVDLSGPSLSDEEPEEPKAPKKKAAKKKAAKKKAPRKPAKNRKGRGGKKKAPKKSAADDIMGMF